MSEHGVFAVPDTPPAAVTRHEIFEILHSAGFKRLKHTRTLFHYGPR